MTNFGPFTGKTCSVCNAQAVEFSKQVRLTGQVPDSVDPAITRPIYEDVAGSDLYRCAKHPDTRPEVIDLNGNPVVEKE